MQQTEVDIVRLLKSDPNSAINSYGIITCCPIGAHNGGCCNLQVQYLGNDVFEITAIPHPDGKDYYFPWYPGGCGEVLVPLAVPKETLVITHGMSGCTHIMSRIGEQVKFVHDAGKYYRQEAQEIVLSTIQAPKAHPNQPVPHSKIHAWRLTNLDPLAISGNHLTSIVARKNTTDWDLVSSYTVR